MLTAALKETDLKLDQEGMMQLIKAYQLAVDVNIISSITDLNGTILYANKKFCEVSKYKLEELVGKNHRIINSGHHPREFFKEMWDTISLGKVWYGEIKNHAKDGTAYWVETVIMPILNSQAHVYRYLSLRILITDKKNTEAERLEYIHQLRVILESTSHRVRAPLSTCMGIINILKEPDLRSEEREQLYLHMEESARKLDTFTQDLTKLISEMETRFGRLPESEIP